MPRVLGVEKVALMLMRKFIGKGKITDMLSQQATLCCRAAGGHSTLYLFYLTVPKSSPSFHPMSTFSMTQFSIPPSTDSGPIRE